MILQGKYTEAEPLYQRALHIQEQQSGPVHPETAEVLHDFAYFQQTQGNLREALSLYQRALTIREHALGLYHHKTKETRQHLFFVLRELGLHEEAVSLQTILSEPIRMKTEHEPHPDR